ncbi:ATPase [Blautia sp. 2744]|uniref:Predicted ATPase of the PP-loop superfamily implicated in cell cycle control n=3 Tax=Blautia TaxID=572511 RepID=D4LSI0_9FIRM|nr:MULTISPECIES: ATP-binding protein [Blautia]MBC5739989.1 ATPase [Blautia intestinalis]RHA46543.1 ATPase [Blautia obeum]RHD32494.1 ATPase [Blautia obeum]RHE38309.1 ATPase [Blautia obeum]CBL23738.1 Predicted ATPase of the PP-loop superfamily implicated in cell cycle control [Blautia obeum A2-162]
MCIRTIEELEQDTREKQVIDIRDKADFEKETYPDAINIYWEELEEHMNEIRKDCPVYLLCYTGQKSEEIAEELKEQGYEIYSVKNGYRAWLKLKLGRLMANHNEAEQRTKDIERSIIKKFRKPIWRRFTKAIREYELVQDGDKIAVCISGGKDSMLMAKLFQELSRHGKKNFEVVFLVMNPGYNEINYQTIKDNAKILNVPITVFESDIFNIVASEEQSPCYLCARMRRGYLYSKAKELGCNKIALGHHYDDVIETILMGMLYGAQVQTMMPKLHSTNFEGMELIRPLYLIREADIIHWANYNDLHFIQCACRFTEHCASCGGTEKGSKRAEIKELIHELAQKDPVIEYNIFRSVENVNLNTVIGYKQDGVRHNFLDTYDDVK